jgi:XPB/Ssl2-like helicase family protein
MEQSDLNLLQTVPPYHLQALVKARRLPYSFKGQNINKSPDPSSMTVTEIAQYLFDPISCRDALSGLAEMEKSILRELVACGGRANSRDLALYFSRLNVPPGDAPEHDRKSSSIGNSSGVSSRTRPHHHVVPPQYPTPHPHGVFEQALHRLLLLGLLFWSKQTNFVGRDYASGVYDGFLIVPQTVMEAVNELWNTGAENTAHVYAPEQNNGRSGENKDVNHVSEGVSEGIRALQRNLYRYWSLVASMREGMPLVSNRLLSRPALRQVVDQLSPAGTSLIEQIRTEADVPQLLFIRLLLIKLGLLSERRGTLHAMPADTFFSLPLFERARRCYRIWLDTTFWNELAYLPDVVVRPELAPLDQAHAEVVQSREQVMERLLAEQPGVWHEFPTFIARTRLYIPYLLFPRQYGTRTERYSTGNNPYGWDFRLRHGWLTPREGWHLVEGGFIRAIISGPLHWLGLVNVDNQDHPDAFRLVQDVALITSETPLNIQEPSWGRLVVQPNFELVALAPVSEELLLNLDRFAERLRLELIAQYRLTKASVTRAIQTGLHAETIQQTLEQAAGGPIPQNVQYSLVEWERQARRIELWRGVTLLEVDDAALLDALFADAETRPLFGRRLAPLLAEVVTDQWSAVQEILWQQDYLPALVSASMHDGLLENGRLPTREPQWRLQHSGLLQPCHAVLDLFLVAEVERITELDEATGWRKITPAAIQQAGNSGVPLDHIVRFLQHYCEGGVPTSFLIRLKLWAGGYEQQDTIGVEHAPLLRLSNQALQDIQSDEELGPLLGTEVPSDSRLVRLPPEVLERVVELLKERGFSID